MSTIDSCCKIHGRLSTAQTIRISLVNIWQDWIFKKKTQTQALLASGLVQSQVLG